MENMEDLDMSDDTTRQMLAEMTWKDEDFYECSSTLSQDPIDKHIDDKVESENEVTSTLFDTESVIFHHLDLRNTLDKLYSSSSNITTCSKSGDASLSIDMNSLMKWEEQLLLKRNIEVEMLVEELIKRYYNAMNSHDVDKSIAFLSACIDVQFTDDADKNWMGIDLAKTKFTGMFQRMPAFLCSINVLTIEEVSHDNCVWHLRGQCHFCCSISNSDNMRVMDYLVDMNSMKIIKIIHN